MNFHEFYFGGEVGLIRGRYPRLRVARTHDSGFYENPWLTPPGGYPGAMVTFTHRATSKRLHHLARECNLFKVATSIISLHAPGSRLRLQPGVSVKPLTRFVQPAEAGCFAVDTLFFACDTFFSISRTIIIVVRRYFYFYI